MFEIQEIPQALERYVNSESKDFTVKAKRDWYKKDSLILLGFGSIWTFLITFLSLVVNNSTRSSDSLSSSLISNVFFFLFFCIGLVLVYQALAGLLKSGSYFIGTPTRLIIFNKKSSKSVAWDQFTGSCDVSGDDLHGFLKFELKTGRRRKTKRRIIYVPDYIHMIDVPNAFAIEQACRKRIQEHSNSQNQRR